MRAFVTGGSGFVGRNLIAGLVDRGDDAVALARSDASARTVEAAGATVARGDLDALDTMREAMAGCDVVFHAAAKVEQWGDPAEFQRVNVKGTANVLAAARAAQVPRVVHISTEAVLVGGPLAGVDETTPTPRRPIGQYPLTKGQAEAAVIAANGDGLATVVVRPRLVWGADDTSVLPVLVDAVESGKFRWINRGEHKTSTCHVDNLVHGALLAAAHGTPGSVYFLTDGEPRQVREFLTAMLQAAGAEPGESSVPLWLARTLARAVEGAWRLFRIRREPPITRTAVELIGQEVTVVDDKARRELGYAPVTSIEDGLAELRAARASSANAG